MRHYHHEQHAQAHASTRQWRKRAPPAASGRLVQQPSGLPSGRKPAAAAQQALPRPPPPHRTLTPHPSLQQPYIKRLRTLAHALHPNQELGRAGPVALGYGTGNKANYIDMGPFTCSWTITHPYHTQSQSSLVPHAVDLCQKAHLTS